MFGGSGSSREIVYECTALTNMKWKDWIPTDYNTIEGTIKYKDEVSIGDAYFWKTGSETPAGSGEHGEPLAGDLIKPNESYYFKIDVECVYPNSNILVSKEGKTVQAKEIKDGNDIVYYNFEKEQVEVGKVEKTYIHKQATDFVRYTFEDGSYLEATNYHPIYTETGWKSYTRRNGYEMPQIGAKVKTEKGWKKLVSIESYEGLEDCYDFVIIGNNGEKVNNYFANGTLVQSSY